MFETNGQSSYLYRSSSRSSCTLMLFASSKWSVQSGCPIPLRIFFRFWPPNSRAKSLENEASLKLHILPYTYYWTCYISDSYFFPVTFFLQWTEYQCLTKYQVGNYTFVTLVGMVISCTLIFVSQVFNIQGYKLTTNMWTNIVKQFSCLKLPSGFRMTDPAERKHCLQHGVVADTAAWLRYDPYFSVDCKKHPHENQMYSAKLIYAYVSTLTEF